MTEKVNKIAVVLVLVISMLFNYLITSVKANDSLATGNVNIRVGLASGINIANIRVEKGSYYLIDEATGFIISQAEPGSLLTIVKKGPVLDVEIEKKPVTITYKGPLVLIPENKNSLNVVSYSNVMYRDEIKLHNEDGGIRLINQLALERYLYGVVGPEMGTNAGIEALKAQAVVSRSYALTCLSSGSKFDVTNNTTTQVYRGYSAETLLGGSNAVKAVTDTFGEVIYYENTLVKAFYHANAGGYTASSENVWHNPLPYLKATPSPYDSYAYDYPHQSGGWPANTYKWEKTVSVTEAQQMIDKFNQNSGTSIGNLVNLSMIKLDYTTQGTPLCDRVTELEVFGSTGTAKVVKDQIRNIFGLKSTKFDIKIDSAVYIKNGSNAIMQMNSADGLKVIGRDGLITEVNGKSNHFTVKNKVATKQIPKTFSAITFDGYGHGHGVGMSQWGARGMAANGYNYKAIIEHYYNQGNYNGKLRILNYYTRGN